MRLVRYKGTDKEALLRKIKQDLGSDAVIVHTSFIKKKGVMKLFGKSECEIIAAKGDFKVIKDYQQHPANVRNQLLKKIYGDTEVGAHRDKAQVLTSLNIDSLTKEVKELKKIVSDVKDKINHKELVGCPEELFDGYMELVNNEVSNKMSEQLIRRVEKTLKFEELKDKNTIKTAIRKTVLSLIRCSDGIDLVKGQCATVAFVGPTGMGKTTTIAKLAAIYKLRKNKEVAIIANDTYRIAAATQIKRIAELINIPIRIATLPADVRRAVQEFKNVDLILIDTAGRSQHNKSKMYELKEVLAAAEPDETHLVVSVTTHPNTIMEVIQRFSDCNFDRIVLTKLDEAARLGLILDVLSKVDKNLSFITTGQNIPQDIEVADANRLAKLIVGEESIARVEVKD
ncbi:MAG: flagellar biosynthesis protein FlhF [Planctomycetes bacterium RBG_16_43_13]|nr:MAG: flagellar biosynthesis protein FlhF [Planctomycetes bacterium RBG_16_43_13]